MAPATSEQAPPPASQRSHWYAKEIVGVPVQLPAFALSAPPSRGVPETEGSAVFAGGIAAIAPVGAEPADAEPPPLVAVPPPASGLDYRR